MQLSTQEQLALAEAAGRSTAEAEALLASWNEKAIANARARAIESAKVAADQHRAEQARISAMRDERDGYRDQAAELLDAMEAEAVNLAKIGKVYMAKLYTLLRHDLDRRDVLKKAAKLDTQLGEPCGEVRRIGAAALGRMAQLQLRATVSNDAEGIVARRLFSALARPPGTGGGRHDLVAVCKAIRLEAPSSSARSAPEPAPESIDLLEPDADTDAGPEPEAEE